MGLCHASVAPHEQMIGSRMNTLAIVELEFK